MRLLKLAFLFLSAPAFAQQLGFALEQINGQALIDKGLSGKGVKIGIIDGGFMKANNNEALSALFDKGLIAGYKDYLNPEGKPYGGSAVLDDQHGTEVWELIAGHNQKKKVQYGLATQATFYLARTDHGAYEKRKEEELGAEAIAWMAAEGVQIINISLGYNFGFNNQQENYLPEQMDGQSTILTQAIEQFSRSHGILFIVAAGNDGNHQWRVVGSPGDAQSALTVGATKLKVWDEMTYSSKGPEWLSYVKPEIACYSSSGTSFATPVITGMAACLLEKDATLTNDELKNIIIQSGSLAYPNNYIGYGVPDASRALRLLKSKQENTHNSLKTSKNRFSFILKEPSIYVTVYHKNDWEVINKEVIRTKKRKIKIKRRALATSSTVIWEEGNMEIIWMKN